MGSTSLLLPMGTHLSGFNLTMVEKLLGSYHLDRNENFEEFLAATGVPLIARKMMVSVSPKITIAKEEDKCTVTFKILIKSFSLTFELGKEFTEDNPISGEKNKCIAEEREGALCIKTTHLNSGLNSTRTFCPTEEGLTVILEAEGRDVQGKRFFKRTV